jgi:1-deoxy-D-xylulose-5-phosphate synthase
MQPSLLAHIEDPKDIRNLTIPQLKQLAGELRDFIIDIVATKEGHLGASLGVVELTIALHYVFDTPNDLLLWDVGHQAYSHKILTGRRKVFHTNRQYGGISGFPKRTESPYDVFGTGHSSTSISAALGMAIASALKGDTARQHIAVIGDASIASGMAFEGLNHAGVTQANLLIILNDNAMAIDPSVGALKNYFTDVKAGKKVRKNNIIEALNFNYAGPVDGHDIDAVIRELQRLQSVPGPKFLHILTTKGKGLKKAEQDQVRYHAPGKFDKRTGEILSRNEACEPPKYQDVFGETLVELAEQNEQIVGISPAMSTGCSLHRMLEKFPDRAFDVGIAEQHAVTLAAGMASQGLIPFCNIYATFLQRAYDQIIHDVALQSLPVVFCIDRAGLVGEDGPTHHGVFDIASLRCIPNLIIMAPLNARELRNALYTAQLGMHSPMAIRYPRGRAASSDWRQPFQEIPIGKGLPMVAGDRLAVLTVGTIGQLVQEILPELPEGTVAWYNMRFVKPLDASILHEVFTHYKRVVTVEDGTIVGGFGAAVLAFAAVHGYQASTKQLGVPDRFVTHGKMRELQEEIQLTATDIKDCLLAMLSE